MSEFPTDGHQSKKRLDWQQTKWLLAGILLLAFCVRVWAINAHLPQLTDPDEPLKLFLAQRMFKTGDLNPHYFLKPTLFIYINALAYIPIYWIGRWRGIYLTSADIPYPQAVDGTIGIGYTTDPTLFIIGRLLTVLIATATVYLVYRLGQRATNRPEVGLVAAFLYALSPIDVRNAQVIATDSYMLFFLTLTALFAINIYDRGTRRDYLLAGMALGLTMAGKYNGALIVVIIGAAHLLHFGWRKLIDRNLIFAAYTALGTFILVTPYALLDATTFFGNVAYEYLHYTSVGHPGGEGNVFLFYLTTISQNLGLVALVALIGVPLYWRAGWQRCLLLLSFPLVHFTFINLFTVRGERMLMLLIPFFTFFAATALIAAYDFLREQSSRFRNPAYAFAVILILVAAGPAVVIIQDATERLGGDSRVEAAAWVEAELPPNSRLIVESYAPYIDPATYEIKGIMTLSRHSPQSLADGSYEYAIFNSQMYQRFLDEPVLYAEEVVAYEQLFDELQLVETFSEGTTTTKIYRIDSDTP